GTVGVGSRWRHPHGAPGWERAAPTTARRMRRCLRRTHALRRRLPERPRALSHGGLQVIDRLDAIQLAFERVELRAQLRDGASVLREIPVELRKNFTASLYDRLVLGRTRRVEDRAHVLVGRDRKS